MRDSFPCHGCSHILSHPAVDLGNSPLANTLPLTIEKAKSALLYPLTLYLCPRCRLIQLPPVVERDIIFAGYPYRSGVSTSWINHCEELAEYLLRITQINEGERVLEVGSNDGSLLECFRIRGVDTLGIDPSREAARDANEKGIKTLIEYFSFERAQNIKRAYGTSKLIIANNVVAHVPDIGGFLRGLEYLLSDDGLICLEFHYLGSLVEHNQFDSIYHEHLSYLSLSALDNILQRSTELEIASVEKISTHGGSLRVLMQKPSSRILAVTDSIKRLLSEEQNRGLLDESSICGLKAVIGQRITKIRGIIDQERSSGRIIAGYGAPAKATTLLNLAQPTNKEIPFIVDENPHKQGRFIPGSAIRITAPSAILERQVDSILLFSWNLREEILGILRSRLRWQGRIIAVGSQVDVREVI